MTVFYIFNSLISFVIIKYLVGHEEFDENNTWFDWHYYINWVEMIANAMTLVIFIELLTGETKHQAMLGIRGTVWAL